MAFGNRIDGHSLDQRLDVLRIEPHEVTDLHVADPPLSNEPSDITRSYAESISNARRIDKSALRQGLCHLNHSSTPIRHREIQARAGETQHTIGA